MIAGNEKEAKKIVLRHQLEAIDEDDEEASLFLNLFSVFGRKADAYSSATEQSYVGSTIMPWIEHYFDQIPNAKRASCQGLLEPCSKQPALLKAFRTSSPATTITRKRSRSSDSPSWLSLAPDYLMKVTVGNQDFGVFACEFKKPNARPTQLLNDRVKLANMMKIMIDRLVLAGVPSPVVCGLCDDGEYTETYKMMVVDEGSYAFVQLASYRPSSWTPKGKSR